MERTSLLSAEGQPTKTL